MTETADILVLHDHCEDPIKQIGAIIKQFPEGKGGSASVGFSFSLSIPRHSDKFKEVYDFLAHIDLQPRPPYVPSRPGLYRLIIRRHYDASDWETARYLQPSPKSSLGLSVKRSRSDRLILRPGHAQQKNLLAAANWPWLAVSDDMRQKLEQAGLQRLKFLDVQYTKQPTPDLRPLWELTSDLRLPRMSPRCKFVNERGGAPVPQWEPSTVLVEGDEQSGNIWPEFHYTESAIRSAEPFDLALTFEGWGGGEGIPKLVASQRFYQFCKAHKLKMDWIPVRIDPD